MSVIRKKYYKGDMIVLESEYYNAIPKGARGTIVDYDKDNGGYIVDFHINYGLTHDCGGVLPGETGLWIPYFLMSKVVDDNDTI
jgi:hypothetical protein